MPGTRDDQVAGSPGRVDRVHREDAPIMYLDVDFDVEAIQAGWPDFESRFTTLRGRRMMAVVFPERGIYRLATVMRDEDDPDALGLSMGALPGGSYLRITLTGETAQVHHRIGPAFDELHQLGSYDPGRPCIEVYESPHQVVCLLPVKDPQA